MMAFASAGSIGAPKALIILVTSASQIFAVMKGELVRM